ncbi:class I SAM-dependent methyltransferase [Bosea sp. Root381]|uniref:class I SAM-dependent methyltransferase n=1 Tax=Bosea sp. Root381 TaxID=1736524 RepID=UPI0009E669B5|nr:class I SAM-dependent methyltransferase [Bosea sp. Root381]
MAREGIGVLRETLKRLEMRARTRMPEPIRRAYRLARSLGDAHPVPGLPEELLADCTFCASREAMLDRLPKGGRIAELGTYRGDFARQILARCRPAELHLVDIDYSLFDAWDLTGSEVVRHLGFTHQVVAGFPDAHFDFVYIDADHSYEGCHRDALAAAPKVRPGGYLVFNDFAHIDPWLGRYGVHRAATDFARAAAWPMAFFAFQPAGLYDVAFQRPE